MTLKFVFVAAVLLLGVGSSGCGAMGDPAPDTGATSSVQQAAADGDNGSLCPSAGYPVFNNDQTDRLDWEYCSCMTADEHIGLLVPTACGVFTLTCRKTTMLHTSQCPYQPGTYPMNRVYDPTNALLGCSCVTTSGLVKTLISKCQAMGATCGYLYCQ